MTFVAKGKLILLRHGETEYNKQKLMTGMADVPLTAVGEEQAREAGRRIAHLPVHYVYASELSRAFNTAALAVRAAGTQRHLEGEDGLYRIHRRAAINELDTGDFTGRCHKTDPEILAWERAFDKALPNGESAAGVVERVQKLFDAEIMPKLEQGYTVMIVAHAGVVRAFDNVLGLTGRDTTRSILNATPVVYDFIDGKLVSETVLLGNGANENKPVTSVKAPRKSGK